MKQVSNKNKCLMSLSHFEFVTNADHSCINEIWFIFSRECTKRERRKMRETAKDEYWSETTQKYRGEAVSSKGSTNNKNTNKMCVRHNMVKRTMFNNNKIIRINNIGNRAQRCSRGAQCNEVSEEHERWKKITAYDTSSTK